MPVGKGCELTHKHYLSLYQIIWMYLEVELCTFCAYPELTHEYRMLHLVKKLLCNFLLCYAILIEKNHGVGWNY